MFLSSQHRCMQGKDSPRRTLENDRRIKKKLDMMMKDRLPKQPKGKKPSSPGLLGNQKIKPEPCLLKMELSIQYLKRC